MVDMHAEQEGRMGRLRVALQPEIGSECPEEYEWPRVAAGMKQGREAGALLRHAAACDHCGPLLHRYPAFRHQHLFVGSGVIAAACKTVIRRSRSRIFP